MTFNPVSNDGLEVNSPSGSAQDASPLHLNQYQPIYASNTAHTPVAITAGTGKKFVSGTPGAGETAIPAKARFVWIAPIAADAYVCFANASATAPTKASTGDLTVPADGGQWFALPLGVDRSFIVDMASSGNCSIVFGW